MKNPIVRKNLLADPNYRPYCGDAYCQAGMVRTLWNPAKGQFECGCGWISGFPSLFISEYRAKWNK